MVVTLYWAFTIHQVWAFDTSPVFCCCYLVTQSWPTLCDPVDCSPPGSLSTGLPRQAYRSGLPFPSPGQLPGSGIELPSSALQAILSHEPRTWWSRSSYARLAEKEPGAQRTCELAQCHTARKWQCSLAPGCIYSKVKALDSSQEKMQVVTR